MDADFLTGLHALAASTADALEGRASLARDADQYQAAEVADLAANGFRALAELAATRLATERARLEVAVAAAKTEMFAAHARFGDADNAAARLWGTSAPESRRQAMRERLAETEAAAIDADAALEAARAALVAFDERG